jgi:hypothetical protein
MRTLQSTRFRFLAMLLLTSIPLVTAAADESGNTQQLKTFFEVTIRQGPSAGVIGYGVLTLNLKSGTDNFTGTLTPAEDPDTGSPFSSVLFQQVDHKLVPDGDVKELAVRGTLHGHAINLIMPDVGGQGKDVFGAGTVENVLGEQSAEQGLGHIAGPAIGPEDGDSGDWLGLPQPIVLRAAPVFTSANTTTFFQGTASSFQVSAMGAPGPTFNEVGTLPIGITLSPGGLLSGTPAQEGTFPITIYAVNGVLPVATQQSFTLVVSQPQTTFTTSALSGGKPVNVAAWSVGVGICHLNACTHILTMLVSVNDNSAFIANAEKALSQGTVFSGTLAAGDLTIVSSPAMIVASLSLQGSVSSSSLSASISIAY